MSNTLYGSLYKAIYNDCNLTPGNEVCFPDVKKIEDLVFTGDSFVDQSERALLEEVTNSDLFFLNVDDEKRLQTLQRGLTLNHYFKNLGDLLPSNTKEHLRANAQRRVMDESPQIVQIELTEKGLVHLHVSEMGKEPYWIEIPLTLPSADEEWEQIQGQLYPFQFLCILDSLSNYLSRPLNEGNAEIGKNVFRQWVSSMIGATSYEDFDYKESIDFLWEFGFNRLLISNQVLTEVDNIFYGDSPTDLQAQALKSAWEHIPTELRQLIKKNGYTVHLVNDATLSRMADRFTELTDLPGFLGMRSDRKLYLLIDQLSVAAMSKVLVHEAGHALGNILSDNNSNPLYGVIIHYLVDETINHNKFPTNYAGLNCLEWFAEAFTLWVYKDEDVVGLSADEYGLGMQFLYKRARERDERGMHFVEYVFNEAKRGNTDGFKILDAFFKDAHIEHKEKEMLIKTYFKYGYLYKALEWWIQVGSATPPRKI